MINKNINANYCLAETSVSNHIMLYYSLKHAFQIFPSIKCNYATTTEAENIIMCLKSVFLNCQAVARYRALASVVPGRERFSWNLSF